MNGPEIVPVLEFAGARVFHGDCLDVLRAMPDASVHAVITDPPYGLEFMGKDWDSFKPGGKQPQIGAGDGTPFRRTTGTPAWGANGNPGCRNCGGQKYGERSCDCDSPDFGNHMAGHMLAFQQWVGSWAAECLRVLKPGGHLLAFGGSRTWHRLSAGIEDAGFEIRDSIAWLYGSGFPKSLDVATAIDKLDAADERLERAREFQRWLREHMSPQRVNELTETAMGHHLTIHPTQPSVATADLFDLLRPELPTVPPRIEELVAQRTVESKNFAAREVTGKHDQGISRGASGVTANGEGKERTAALTPEARAWEGWGTALKPSFEPIVVARKPLTGTVAASVLANGTGAMNIDAVRLGAEEGRGRWPTNVVLDQDQAAALDTQSGILTSGKLEAHHSRAPKAEGILGAYGSAEGARGYGDRGGASRYFPTISMSLEDEEWQARVARLPIFRYEAKAATSERPSAGGVQHPTVKPLELMRWLVRLVTPPDGVVLEPFAGSGTTLEACVREGFSCIGIEREAEYIPLIEARLSKPQQQSLFGDWGGDAA